MVKKLYLVIDEDMNEIVNDAVYETEASAREAALDFLKNTKYASDEWDDTSIDLGYKTVEAFEEDVRQTDVHDDWLMIRVQELSLLP